MSLQLKISKLLKVETLAILDFFEEIESADYSAARFVLNQKNIIFREAKITPTKVGLFVVIWKRSLEGSIAPFHENDDFDLIQIYCQTDKGQLSGMFSFPKEILIKNKIVSSEQTEGKKGIRVYPPWAIAINKQALATQKWQIKYFDKV